MEPGLQIGILIGGVNIGMGILMIIIRRPLARFTVRINEILPNTPFTELNKRILPKHVLWLGCWLIFFGTVAAIVLPQIIRNQP